MIDQDLIDDYRAAKHHLGLQVREQYPVGSYAQARKSIVGRVHCYHSEPDFVTLILSHGNPVTFSIDDLTPAERPYWDKAQVTK